MYNVVRLGKSFNKPFVKIFLRMQELIITTATAVMLYILASYYRWWNFFVNRRDMQQQAIMSQLLMLFCTNLAVKIFNKWEINVVSWNFERKAIRIRFYLVLRCMKIPFFLSFQKDTLQRKMAFALWRLTEQIFLIYKKIKEKNRNKYSQSCNQRFKGHVKW